MRRIAASLLLLCVSVACRARFPALEEDSRWADPSLTIYYRDVDDPSRIKSVALDGSDKKDLIPHPVGAYEISASGERVAFQDPEHMRCGVFDLLTRQTVWVPVRCKDFELSPDGGSLAYVTGTDKWGDDAVFILRVDPLEAIPVSEENCQMRGGPRWSRDGSHLYFFDMKMRGYSFDPVSSTLTKLDSEPSMEDLHFNQWDSPSYGWYRAISPSGRYVADNDMGSLVLVNRSTGERRVVLRNEGSYNPDFGAFGVDKPVWLEEDRYIVGQTGGSITVVDVSSGRAGVLTRGMNPLAYYSGYRPDPNTIANLLYDSELKMQQ